MTGVVRRGLAAALAAAVVSPAFGQSSISICDDANYRGTPEYNKYCVGSAGSTAPSGAASGGGLTPQQQMTLNGMQMMMPALQQGIHNAIYGDPAQKAREEAAHRAKEAEERRLKEENERRFAEKKARVLGQLSGGSGALKFKDDEPSSSPTAEATPAPAAPQTSPPAASAPGTLAFKDDEEPAAPANKDGGPKSAAYQKGFDAASRCGTQNSGPACADVAGEAAETCLNDYRAGYEVGRKQTQAALDLATRKGAGAAMSRLPNNAASEPDSNGDCRTQWVEAYNRGYFPASHSPAAKK